MKLSWVELFNAVVTGITESKLGESIFQIDIYDLLRCGKNRNSGDVACYIRNDISYEEKVVFPNVIKGIFFEILLPSTTSITVGIMNRPPKQFNFLEILNITFEKTDTDKKRDVFLAIST